MIFWIKTFFGDRRAHGLAAEEVFFVCVFSLAPLFLLAFIDHLHAGSPQGSQLFWNAIAAGQLYLYSFSLFGILFWLCQKEHENFDRFKPRRYLMFVIFIPSLLILGVYLLNPSLSKPLTPELVKTSFAIYLLYVALYYILLVFDHFEPRPLEEVLQENTGALIDEYEDLGDGDE